jgi:CDGSH-type Zn-finger protein
VKKDNCGRTTVNKPKISSLEPKQLKLEPKSYWWCACGHSSQQPFCDGTHNSEADGITPVKFDIIEEKEVWLCMCKHTGNPPYCDGMHCKLEEYKDK